MVERKIKKGKKKESSVPTNEPSTNAGQAVELRSSFFKSINKALSIAIISAGAALVISSFSLYLAANKNAIVKFVAVNEEGKLVKLQPLDKPNLSDEAVMQWATKALVETFTMSAYDINYRLNEATAKYFTKQGAEAFLTAMKDTGNYDQIIDRKLFVSIALEEVPIIIGNDLINGRYYAWNIMAPAKITYRTGSQTYTNNVNVELTLIRRSILENESGLGINKIVWTNI